MPAVIPLGCLYEVNYFDRLFFKTALPIALCSFFAVVGSSLLYFFPVVEGADMDIDNDGVVTRAEYFKAKPKAKMLANTFSAISFYVIFLVYPSASTAIFQFFVCDSFNALGDDNFRYLRADMSISCDSDAYKINRVFAVAMAFPRSDSMHVYAGAAMQQQACNELS